MNQNAFRLRRNLDAAFPPPEWPAGFSSRTLLPEDAPEVHRLLQLAYAQTRDIPEYAAWWAGLSGDSEFDPALCFLAFDAQGRLAGAALCWTSAFLKDLAVRPEARRFGLGENLLRLVFSAFRERGASAVDLKVDAGNADAIRLYERAGMYSVPFSG